MLKPKKSVENMTGYYVPMYEKNWDVKIDSNENNYGPSPCVISALSRLSFKDVSFYPFYGELTEKISKYYNVPFECIKVTNGADEALQGIIQTYLEKNDSLLTLDVSFDMPVIYTEIQGGNVIKIPFEKKWEFPVNKFTEALKDNSVKIVYIASPNNPTGNIISDDDVKRILNASENKAVIIDETYANYCGLTYKKYIDKYPNLFIVRSFSKDFALAGMRLGVILTSEENILNLKKVISPFSVNALAVKAGIAALSDIDYFESVRTEITKSKEDLKIFLETLGAHVYPSYANFLTADFGTRAEFVYKKLKSENISVKLFKKGTRLENHLRITVPNKHGLEKLKSALKIKPLLAFDMDGVLIDVQNSYRKVISLVYKEFTGNSVSEEEISKAKNAGGLNNDWDLTKYLLDKAGVCADYDKIVDAFQKIYWDNSNGLINDETFLFNKDLIKKLSQNYNLAIYTGRPTQEAIYTLKKFEVYECFNPVLTFDDVPKDAGKPNPYGLMLMKKSVIANEFYYFGDTPDDIKAAIGAEFTPIGVLPPQDKSESLRSSLLNTGAKFVTESINDIENILERNYEAKC